MPSHYPRIAKSYFNSFLTLSIEFFRLIQTISKFTIVYWSMDGILQVHWRGVGTIGILPQLRILIGMAVLITSVSIWQFKKGHVF